MIEFKAVSKTYITKKQTVQALDNVNLQIQDGDIFGIIGLSGAGKSTLIGMINALETPTSGEVLVNGVDIAKLPFSEIQQRRRKIGMIFQQFNLLNSRTVRHNISLPLIISGTPSYEITARVNELLRFVGLQDKAEQYPDQLSGGQKQRVGIARALATSPDILLSDEATSALDPDTMESILQLLKKVNRELHITIVMVTHQIRVIQRICNQVAVMKDGRIIESGDVFSVFSNPREPLTQEFVRTIIPDQLTPSVLRDLQQDVTENFEILRLKFMGKNALGDLLYQLNTQIPVRTRILHATVTELVEQPLGIMIIQVVGSAAAIQAAEAFIVANGVQFEEVKHGYGL